MGVLDFAGYIIFNSVFGKEEFDLGVLDFAYINISITIYGEEELDLGVLGRGRAGQIAILYNFM